MGEGFESNRFENEECRSVKDLYLQPHRSNNICLLYVNCLYHMCGIGWWHAYGIVR